MRAGGDLGLEGRAVRSGREPTYAGRCHAAACAFLTAACIAATASGRIAGAQTAVPPEDVAAIARSLNCPLCQGYNLQDCPLEVCAQMRDEIRQRLAAGETPDEIVAAFVEDYGPQVLNAPPRSGVLASAWLVPPVVLAAAAVVAVLVVRGSVRRRRAIAGRPDGAGVLVDPVYTAELDRLLAEDSEG